MQTLSYGYKLPENADHGSVFFPAAAFDIQRLNDHTHNGTNSALLTAAASSAASQVILAASWVEVGSGDSNYRQLVTMPANITFEAHSITARINSGGNAGNLFYPSIEKVSANTFYLYINDNTVDVKVLYT